MVTRTFISVSDLDSRSLRLETCLAKTALAFNPVLARETGLPVRTTDWGRSPVRRSVSMDHSSTTGGESILFKLQLSVREAVSILMFVVNE